MAKTAFLIDYQWCTGCHTCEVACQMELQLPPEQFGIKIAELGPWPYGKNKWQYTYIPLPTDQCNFCQERRIEGKLAACEQHCQSNCIKIGDYSELSVLADGKDKQVLITVE